MSGVGGVAARVSHTDRGSGRFLDRRDQAGGADRVCGHAARGVFNRDEVWGTSRLRVIEAVSLIVDEGCDRLGKGRRVVSVELTQKTTNRGFLGFALVADEV